MLASITCGRPLASIEGGGFVVTDVQYAAGDEYPCHSHQQAYLILICSGSFAENAGRESAELTSGDVLVMPGGHPHHDVIGVRGARGLLVTLRSSFAWKPRQWRAYQGGGVSRAMIALHRAVRAGGEAEALAIEEHLLEAIAGVAPASPEPADTRTVRRARELLESQAALPLRLGDVARQAGVTAPHMARAFRRLVGRTMGTHLRAIRARRAAAMLASSGDDLAGIALAAGFADQSHLSRVFKSEYGITPHRYRQLMRGSNRFKI
jgi:AraC family transcriptional regulator